MSEHFEKKISRSKEALLRSCVQMLSTRTWDEISIDDIEKYIHKTRGAIFHHYKTKDELFTNALIYFIESNSISCSNSSEPKCTMLIRSLKNEFEVEFPERAFINLITQAIIKKINVISILFKSISTEYISQEEYALGQIMFQSIINE